MRKGRGQKDRAERGSAALAASLSASALLVGTWVYMHRELSDGRHVHIGLHLVLADVFMPVLALGLVWEWVRDRRGRSKRNSRHQRRCRRGGDRKDSGMKHRPFEEN
jgi:hypothetical protein